LELQSGRAGSTKEFYVAEEISPLANGMATAADWMSASFISMAVISFDGYDGAVYLMGWTGGYVLLALLLAHICENLGNLPFQILLENDSNTRTVCYLCISGFFYLRCRTNARGGLVFSKFLEVDINTGVIIGMIIVLFYATLGGMKLLIPK
jgi:cation/acetate symporter